MKKGLNKEQRYYLAILKAKQHDGGGIYAAYEKPSVSKIEAYYAIKRDAWSATVTGCAY